MKSIAVTAVLMLFLPLAVFLGGARLLLALSGREQVVQQLERKASVEDRKPLYQRLHYDVSAVQRQWGVLDAQALEAERKFLVLDLVFPLFYGAALLISLLLGARLVAPAMNPEWLVGCVAVTILSDWTENLLQLNQLRRFAAGGAAALDAKWIAVASIATVSKLLFFSLSSLAIVVLAGLAIARSR
jgi:hypothetical protein